jgi:hypothetical protein
MALGPGFYKAKIVSHTIGASMGKGTPFINFTATIEGEPEPIVFPVWISEKAMGMARASLKKCGFNIDEHELKELRENKTLLAGNEVVVEYEDDPQYGPRFQIALSQVSNEALDGLTKSLRNAKKKQANTDDDDDLPF